jgi:hypothetical protein
MACFGHVMMSKGILKSTALPLHHCAFLAATLDPHE